MRIPPLGGLLNQLKIDSPLNNTTTAKAVHSRPNVFKEFSGANRLRAQFRKLA
jgi:hypothetical protein